MKIHSAKGLQEVSESKRDLIMKAALILFEERGFDGTTVPMIVEKAGVGAGTLYRYFENKESLVNTLFQECVMDLLEIVKKGYPHSSEDVYEQFQHISNQVISYLLNNMYALLFLDSHANRHYLDETSRQSYNMLRDFFIDFIRQGQQKNIIRPLPADALLTIVDGAFIALNKAIRFCEIKNPSELIAGVQEACWDAVRIH